MAEELNPGSTLGFNSGVQSIGKDTTSSHLNATQCICDDISSQLTQRQTTQENKDKQLLHTTCYI
ncbi:hypothetical protein IFM47457_03884 [Aspergillus lentulus]|nr:hypothetical protein IFM47457_03884 [Aspergillus lentulus]